MLEIRKGLEHGFDLERSAGDDWRLDTDNPPPFSMLILAAEDG